MINSRKRNHVARIVENSHFNKLKSSGVKINLLKYVGLRTIVTVIIALHF
jgi:hypothetical protein